MNELKLLWNQITLTKVKRTTFGVASMHIISSTFLFPVVWLIIGLFAKALLVKQNIAPEFVVSVVYYLIMLGCFYMGIRYSLYYIDKKVQVALPKQSARQSVVFFVILVISANIGLFYFEKALNIQRIIFSILLLYLFIKMTIRYFDTLNQTEYLECRFFSQIIVLLANLSLLLSFLFIYAFIRELNPVAHLIVMAVAFYAVLFIDNFDTLFVSFFYLPHESKPIKKALLLLLVSVPLNVILWSVIFQYFQSHYSYM